MFLRKATTTSTENYLEQIIKLKHALDNADAVVIGAGAGLSTSAGFEYGGARFKQYFSDFEEKYGFHDMYSGGFTRSKHRKNIGRTGPGLFMSTAIRIRRNLLIVICSNW